MVYSQQSTVYSSLQEEQAYGLPTTATWMERVQPPPPQFPTLMLQFPQRHCSSSSSSSSLLRYRMVSHTLRITLL